MRGCSIYYKTFSNVLTVCVASSEHLITIKLMSGRQYKNDLSDVAENLWEHHKRGYRKSYKCINNSVGIPKRSKDMLESLIMKQPPLIYDVRITSLLLQQK